MTPVRQNNGFVYYTEHVYYVRKAAMADDWAPHTQTEMHGQSLSVPICLCLYLSVSLCACLVREVEGE